MNDQCFHIRSLALARRTVSDWHLDAGLYLTGTRTQDPVEEQAAPAVVVWDLRPDVSHVRPDVSHLRPDVSRLRPDVSGLAPVVMAAPSAAPGAALAGEVHSLSLTHKHKKTLSLSHTLSLSFSLSHTHTLSLSHTHNPEPGIAQGLPPSAAAHVVDPDGAEAQPLGPRGTRERERQRERHREREIERESERGRARCPSSSAEAHPLGPRV